MVLGMRIVTIVMLVVLIPLVVVQLKGLIKEFAEDIKKEMKETN